MAKKIKLTRPELKRYRDALTRFERYLPMLKLKQQQLQLTIREVWAAYRKAQADADAARATFEPYSSVLADVSGVNVRELARPEEVKTSSRNVAGVTVPVFESVNSFDKDLPNFLIKKHMAAIFQDKDISIGQSIGKPSCVLWI